MVILEKDGPSVQYAWSSYKKGTRGHGHSHGRKPHEDEGRDRADAAESGQHQRLPTNTQKPGWAWGKDPLTASEGSQPANTLISDFQPSWNHQFLFFKFYLIFIAIQLLYNAVSFYCNSKVNLSGDLNRKEIQKRDDQFPLFNHSVCGICCKSSSRLTDGE